MWGVPDLKEVTIMLTVVPTVPDQEPFKVTCGAREVLLQSGSVSTFSQRSNRSNTGLTEGVDK
jgi:hypothetical protein